ncbi:Isochorismatase family, putative [Leishmania donovani]|uniref:Isochorismatase family, putative n=1 Tax=Leishmania donovani TaxID=5661 RepID=A0A3S7WQ71_LEIDO|nr:Isochorismatase family, putative [Leishmania donovani]
MRTCITHRLHSCSPPLAAASALLLGVVCAATPTQTHVRYTPERTQRPPSPMTTLSAHSRLIQKFDTCRTAFMLCRAQVQADSHIPSLHNVVHATNAMAAVHQLLGPERSVFVATEVHPQGVGHTCHGIQLPEDVIIAKNVRVSMLVPKVRSHILGDAERGIPPVQQVVIWGYETCGCILQTADDLLTHGVHVAVLVDGCASQTMEMHNTAVLQLSHWDGLMVTTVPSAVMQLTRSDARFVKPIIQVMKKFAADWSTTQPRPELRDWRGGGDGGEATAANDARAAPSALATTTAADAVLTADSACCRMDH